MDSIATDIIFTGIIIHAKVLIMTDKVYRPVRGLNEWL